MSIIFLIGMPFAGKTYWAKALSEYYKLPFADMDTLITKQTGKTVAQLFETEGQDAFRKREHDLLKQIIASHPKPLIVSCGGGTPVFFDNMQLMKDAGCTVYLEAGVETLIARFEQVEEGNERPLLASVTDVEEEFFALLQSRKYIYEQAHYTLPCEQLSVSNFAQIFSICTNRP